VSELLKYLHRPDTGGSKNINNLHDPSERDSKDVKLLLVPMRRAWNVSSYLHDLTYRGSKEHTYLRDPSHWDMNIVDDVRHPC